MSSALKQTKYSELEKQVETYLESDYSMRVEESENYDHLVIDSEEDIFDQVLILGNDMGSRTVTHTKDSTEYRLTI